MRAVLSKSPGGPAQLAVEEVPDPQPGPGQLVVAVAACGVNFPDALIIEDRYQFKPARPFSPGGEIAGVVSAVGTGVERFKTGDQIIGFLNWGGMAEKAVVEEQQCIAMPDDMPFDQASALMVTYGTSYYGLKDRGALAPGETLLVLGAAGGVGLAAVELGKAMGARVVAAASSTEKVAIAVQHGAEVGVVYPRSLAGEPTAKALADEFKRVCGADGAHVIFDAVGGDYSEAALRAIAWEGRFLVVGFPAGIPRLPLNLTLLKSCQVVGVFWAAWVKREPRAFHQRAGELLAFYRRGLIKPRISDRFPLEKAGDAIRCLAERKAVGKIVVTVK
jgi:NADPH2:quinone reductase